MAVVIAAPSEQRFDVNAGDPTLTPHIQEMLDEANRVGGTGDLRGKADLLSQAGYSGSAKAFYDLARMYLDGSLPKDESLAIKYITLAHDDGYAEATRVLGMLYLRGQGIPADESYGRLLLEKAAKTSPRASREYGQLLANLSSPELNSLDLGIKYLRDALDRGDAAASPLLAKALSRAGRTDEAEIVKLEAPDLPVSQANSGGGSLKERAQRGDSDAMFSYAQQVMLRKIPAKEPEFTAYCWLSVAKEMGSAEAGKELGFIKGVRIISDKKDPGRLDRCIRDLHYQVSGTN
ncbi:tetratricopeptide repeat protein [Pseudomonas tritici]|uniref:tetratricopeptide repeat protein n=1 Tax=Pseudomonas tritici TaxID=2745518 RepID=UPI00387B8335